MRITSLTTPLGTDSFGNDVLVFRKIHGHERMNSLFEYTLTVHSTQPDIAPKQLLGKSVSITVQDQFQNPVKLNAIVAEFKFLGGDQRRTLYEAKLVPWLWLADQAADCKIFQNMSVVDIVSEVLGEYPFPIKKKLLDTYRKRLFTVMYNESHFAFISRLLEDEGIGYHFEHDADTHTLVLTDFCSSMPKISGHETIPFRAPDSIGISDEETISQWHPAQSIKSGSFGTSDYFYRGPKANLEQRSFGTTSPKQHDHDNLPVFNWEGQGHFHDDAVGNQIAKIRQDEQQQQFQVTTGQSNVRALLLGATGSRFTLRDHPRREMNKELLVISTEMSLNENPSTTSEGEHTDWEVNFTVVPSDNQYRPQRVTPLPKIYGAQTAIVTGPANQEIWTNDLGQIRIRPWWDRYSSDDEHASCWVRVASNWAGSAWGGEALPRIGTEVIVIFLDGNPDRPLVVGRVVNSDRVPPSFSNSGALPENQALAGIKSKELGGSRYNQLLFDDTNGEIRAQLESEHAKSQLNLGYLTHPRSGDALPRGEGFELRTDAWGALRAARGLLVSTNAKLNGAGDALERKELSDLLKETLALAKTLGEFASKNLGNDSDPEPQATLSKAVTDLGHSSNTEKGENGGNPVFAVSAAAGIALGTPKSTTIATGEHLDLVSQQNQHITAGKVMNLHAGEGLSHFAVKGGIKSIAHKGKHIIKAHDDEIQIVADKSVTMTSSNDNITLAANKFITLTSGGAYIKIADGNIQIHCPGTIDMKAGNYTMVGPDSMQYPLPVLPHAVCKPCLKDASANTSPFAAFGA